MPSPVRPATGVAALVLALAGAAASGTALEAQEPFHGPFRVVEQNPLFRLLHTPQSERADLLPAGRFRVDAGAAYGNLLEISRRPGHLHTLDMERLTMDVEGRWAPSDGWEVGAGLRTGADWGGFLDGFISDFHDIFGFPDGNRGEVENDRYAFELVNEDRRVSFQVADGGAFVDDVRLFAKRRLHRSADGSRAVSARGVVSVAAGPPGVEAGRTDVAAEVLARQSVGRWHWHGGLGVTTLTPPEGLEPVTRNAAVYLLAGGERLLTDGVSLVAQFVGGSGYFHGTGDREIDGRPMNLVFGFAGGGGTWSWQLSFAEDVPPGSPSTDFSLSLRGARTF